MAKRAGQSIINNRVSPSQLFDRTASERPNLLIIESSTSTTTTTRGSSCPLRLSHHASCSLRIRHTRHVVVAVLVLVAVSVAALVVVASRLIGEISECPHYLPQALICLLISLYPVHHTPGIYIYIPGSNQYSLLIRHARRHCPRYTTLSENIRSACRLIVSTNGPNVAGQSGALRLRHPFREKKMLKQQTSLRRRTGVCPKL